MTPEIHECCFSFLATWKRVPPPPPRLCVHGAAGGGDAGEPGGSAGGVSVAGERMCAGVAPLVCKVKVLGFPRAVPAQCLWASCAVPREDASKHASRGVKAHSSCAWAQENSWARRASPSVTCTLSYSNTSFQDTKATQGLWTPLCVISKLPDCFLCFCQLSFITLKSTL